MGFARAIGAAGLVALATQQTPQQGSGLVAGRIVDAAGTPIPAATVVLMNGPVPDRPMYGMQPGTEKVLTDDSGRFVFSNVSPGTHRLEASKPGWLPGAFGRRRPGGAQSSFELGDGERRNDLLVALWRTAIIGGRVTDDTGDPLIGVEVRAVRQVFIAGRRQNDMPTRARTDDRGVYRFSDLMPGEYIVAVLASVLSEPPGFSGAVREQQMPQVYYETMTGIGAAPMVFERATGAVSTDRPLVGSLSSLVGMPTADGAWPAYPTTFFPSSLTQSGATIVRAESGQPRTDVDVSVRLTPTLTVSGTLRDAEGPAPWHGVHLVPAESGDRPLVDVATAVTDGKGAFTFYGVPPGRYNVRVIRVPTPAGISYGLAGGTGEIPQVLGMLTGPPDTIAPSNESLWFADQQVIVVDRAVRDLAITMREGARLRGRVRFDGQKAQPTAEELKAAKIFLWPASGRSDDVMMPAPISSDGRFMTGSVWPGRYLVSATPPPGWYFKDATYQNRDVSSRAFDLTNDLDNVVITFTDRAQTIKGSVQVEAGSSADAATVILFPTDSALWVDYGRTSRLMASARVSVTGVFTLRLPPAGDYFIIAIPEDAADQWQNPAFLTRLAPLAERVHIAGDASLTQQLQLKQVR